MKRAIGVAVLILAAAGFIVAAKDMVDMHGRRNTSAVHGSRPETSLPAGTGCRIDAYFFFGSSECPTCDVIKEVGERVVSDIGEDGLNGLLRSLSWEEVNVEEKGNEQYILDYELYTTTVVLADASDPQRWKRLDEVWDTASDRKRLEQFIRLEILEFAKGCDQ